MLHEGTAQGLFSKGQSNQRCQGKIPRAGMGGKLRHSLEV